MNFLERFKRLTIWNKVAFIGAIASITAIPLAITLWYSSPQSGNNKPNSEKTMISNGNNSPVIDAGRDVELGRIEGESERKKTPDDQSSGTHHPSDPSSQNAANKMTSAGDNSPVIKAGRDVIISPTRKKPDYVTDHDGAGALLMTEPDFKAFIASTMDGEGDKIVGRLVNGTEVAKIELKPANREEPSPPWAKVKVLEGELKDSVGWILMNALRKP